MSCRHALLGVTRVARARRVQLRSPSIADGRPCCLSMSCRHALTEMTRVARAARGGGLGGEWDLPGYEIRLPSVSGA